MVVRHHSKGKHAAQKKSAPAKTTKKRAPKKPKADSKLKKKKVQIEVQEVQVKKSTRPEDEVVTYAEYEYELREIPSQGNQVLIGPPWLTRFEKARITGARSLQLSLGAPSLARVPGGVNDSISLAALELDQKALPISIRRILPNGLYQDISIDSLK